MNSFTWSGPLDLPAKIITHRGSNFDDEQVSQINRLIGKIEDFLTSSLFLDLLQL
jgi:hypothetical protein